MTRVRLVKCSITHNGGAPGEMDLRFVPLQEFGLWEYYMRQRYGWGVRLQNISYWIDEDSYLQMFASLARNGFEPVYRVTIEWVAADHVIIPQERYFPSEKFEYRKEQFLKHYPATRLVNGVEMNSRRVEETRGYFLAGYEVRVPEIGALIGRA